MLGPVFLATMTSRICSKFSLLISIPSALPHCDGRPQRERDPLEKQEERTRSVEKFKEDSPDRSNGQHFVIFTKLLKAKMHHRE